MQKIALFTTAVLSSACLSEIRGDIEDFDLESISRTEGQGRIPSAIDQINDPRGLNQDIVTRLAELPASGSLRDVPWSGSYWPKNKGGIAYRLGRPVRASTMT